MRTLPLLCLCAVLLACVDDPPPGAAAGGLALALSSEAGGVTYRLSRASFVLDGPERREFGAGDEAVLMLELPAGAYTLTLLDGYALTRADDAGAAAVEARLVSKNPAPVLVAPGQTTQLSLRFELVHGASAPPPGRLAIDLAVADAAQAPPACAADLRIAELDYEQGGSDDAEFVEIVNPAGCDAPLTGVALELVNGGDGKVYARYELAQAAESLAGGARLVLGDPAVLALLPPATLPLALHASGLQNGPDGVRLLRGEQVLDALAYEGAVPGIEGGASAADEAEQTLSRCPDTFDTGDHALDFQLTPASPGAANACM